MNNERYSRQASLVPGELLTSLGVSIVGIGAIGRQVALQLTAIGVNNLKLIDFDTVEESNVASQGYFESDIGHSKVEATGNLCSCINSEAQIEKIFSRYRANMKVGPIIFSCVDDMDVRKLIYEHNRNRMQLLIDGRMAGETIRVIKTSINEEDQKYYETTLYSNEEATEGSCTAKTTIYSANIAAGLMVSTFAKWLRNVANDLDIVVSLTTNDINILK